MSFKQWIIQFIKEDNAFGDLARDIKNDKYFPKGNMSDIYIDYLEKHNASEEAKHTFVKAWRQFHA